MSNCRQCGEASSFWCRDFWTGLCPKCRQAPDAEGRQTRSRRVSIAALIFLSCVIGAVGYCTPVFNVLFLDRRFSSAGWLQGDVHVRGRMARDLVYSGKLLGKTEAGTHALLGSPDIRYSTSIAYTVDTGSRLRSRFLEMHIMFDKLGMVYSVWLE